MHIDIVISDHVTEGDLRNVLGNDLHLSRARSIHATFLDTFDWRIASRGARLWLESASGRRELRWIGRPNDPVYAVPIQGNVTWATDLPEGHLQSEIGPLLGIRALIEVGSSRVQRRTAEMRDPDGNNTVHIQIDTSDVLDASGATTGRIQSTARVVGVPGFERDFKKTVKKLGTLALDGGETADLLEIAASARGRSVGDYSSKLRLKLDPDLPAEEALRCILQTLLNTLEANVDGTIADVDTEFLHDLRVASRRTRSALTQVKGVLPADDIATFMTEFKWLGTVTGPCRDLDVFLMEMEGYLKEMTELAEALLPLQRVIERARGEAHRNVCTALRSDRFSSLLKEWGAYLASETPSERRSPNADIPILKMSSGRIFKAYRRMIKRGKKLSGDPPPEALHQLRIDAKKLRYLLEFFRSLFPEKDIDRLVRELKGLQDVLGGFNDMEVQQGRLESFVRKLSSANEDHAQTLMAMGRLTAVIVERQETYRRDFADRFEDFAHQNSQNQYNKLFGTRA